MKKIFLAVLFLVSSNLFAQDNGDEERHHKKEKIKKDYFSIGLYGGGHVSNSFEITLGPVNSIAGEIEYRKSKKWGFYVKGLYEFVSQDIKQLFMYQSPVEFNLINVKNPNTFTFVFNFGGRYYLKNGNVSPYFQAGLSNETSYMGDYTYTIDFGKGGYSIYRNNAYFHNYLSLDFGVGGKISLSKKISLDIQADVYHYIGKENHNAGYSALIGLKYSLF